MSKKQRFPAGGILEPRISPGHLPTADVCRIPADTGVVQIDKNAWKVMLATRGFIGWSFVFTLLSVVVVEKFNIVVGHKDVERSCQ